MHEDAAINAWEADQLAQKGKLVGVAVSDSTPNGDGTHDVEVEVQALVRCSHVDDKRGQCIEPDGHDGAHIFSAVRVAIPDFGQLTYKGEPVENMTPEQRSEADARGWPDDDEATS